MTHLADLAVRLFWLHEDITDTRVLPFMRHWEEHGDVQLQASSLSPRQKDELLGLCLDLTVQFARTCVAVVGPECLDAVISDNAGRGWETTTRRSEEVRPTLAAIPVDRVLMPWALEDRRSMGNAVEVLSPDDEEALWQRIIAEEPDPSLGATSA